MHWEREKWQVIVVLFLAFSHSRGNEKTIINSLTKTQSYQSESTSYNFLRGVVNLYSACAISTVSHASSIAFRSYQVFTVKFLYGYELIELNNIVRIFSASLFLPIKRASWMEVNVKFEESNLYFQR